MSNRFLMILTGLQILVLISAKAQVDPHFSQYYANPLWLNPALTGVVDAEARVNLNYKNQWQKVNDAYETAAISVDFNRNDRIGYGITILNQGAGNSYNQFSGYGSLSYGIRISNDGFHRLKFGMQAGMINRSFNRNLYQFGNQFVPGVGYDPSIGSMEQFNGSSVTVFDANAGIYYHDTSPLRKMNPFVGFSAGHLTRPRDSFTDGLDLKIPVRYAVHGGLQFKTSSQLTLTPNALYIQQQKASIKALGLSSEFNFPDENSLIIGAMYRFEDAAIAHVGYRINNLVAGASYDFNTSSLSGATYGQGGIELSISYQYRKRVKGTENVGPRL